MDDSQNAQVGEIVECINAKPSGPGMTSPFVEGGLYKVAELGLTRSNKRPAYRLEGIPEFWTRTRFRRLPPEKKKADDWIAELKKLGDNVPGTPVKTPEFEDA